MVYRQAAPVPEERPILVRYGWLPLPWGAIGGAAICLFLGLVLLASGADRERIHCERSSAQEAGRCVAESDLVLFRWHRRELDLGRVRAVLWVPYEGSKGADMGKTEMIDQLGRSLDLADGPRDEARRIYQALRGFYDDRDQRSLDESESLSVFSIGLGVAFLVALIGSLIWFLRQTTSLRMVIDREAGSMVVQRRHYGLGGKTTRVDLSEVTGVEVEEGKLELWYQNRGAQGKPAGRVVLVTREGARRPVTEELLLGRAVHHRAATRLAEALRLLRPEPLEPAAPVASPRAPAASSFALPFKARYLVLLVAALMVPSVYVFISEQRSGPRGTIEVRCVHRCRMGSSECLPGGRWRSEMAAGVYEIEVWNPEVSGSWERQRFEVVAGQRRVFECRPGAR